jgi:hypothetical protein
MLATVAALIIVLGLMVSLARYVRDRSANVLTKDLLLKLDLVMAEYQKDNDGQLPPVAPFQTGAGVLDEATIEQGARKNNQEFVRCLRRQQDLSTGVFNNLPISIYDEVTLRDAWGTPIVFMPQMHPAVGMAPHNRFFFFSAGPDRQFLTREDNLYSYETSAGG